MILKQDRIMRLKDDIENILKKFENIDEKQEVQASVTLCKECLDTVPEVDIPVYVHIIGTDKSFKTSYLLDLFDNNELRQLFGVKVNNTSENTAVPCLIEPSDKVSKVTIRQLSISSKKVINKNVSPELFSRLYDLSKGAVPNDYLIQILVPSNKTVMRLPVIEYPGIKQGADALEEQKYLHKTFQANLVQNLVKFPGILVACFQHKIAIPLGHPMDIILKKYGQTLKSGILSFSDDRSQNGISFIKLRK